MSDIPERCDVLVVGAGPAGSAAAIAAAQAGASTVLVDLAAFPRVKPCGCCLRGRARRELDVLGATAVLDGAPRVGRLRLAARSRVRELRIPGLVACSRGRLDLALARRAEEAGATVSMETTARPAGAHAPGAPRAPDAPVGRGSIGGDDHRLVTLSVAGGSVPKERRLAARVVVAADGLRSAFAAALGLEPRCRAVGWIGAGAVLPSPACAGAPESGVLEMACGAFGYVGAVRLEDGAVDVAAALDPGAVRRLGGLAPAVARLRAAAGLPPLELDGARWRGTPTLSRIHDEVAAERLLLAGDALGYREPFTGEGIGWALAGGRAMGALAAGAAREGWTSATVRAARRARRRLAAAQGACVLLGGLARRPALLAALLGVLPPVSGDRGPGDVGPGDGGSGDCGLRGGGLRDDGSRDEVPQDSGSSAGDRRDRLRPESGRTRAGGAA